MSAPEYFKIRTTQANEVNIPYLTRMDLSYEELVYRDRTASGKIVQYHYADPVKTWTIATLPLDYSTATEIRDLILDNGGQVQMKYDKEPEWIWVVARITNFTRVEYTARDKSGSFEDDFIELGLEFEEIGD